MAVMSAPGTLPPLTSSATSTAVDLSRLPPPDMVETLDYEVLLAAIVAEFSARHPQFDAFLESDPAMKLLQIVAFREMILRQRINDAGRGLLLAYAVGGDLDNLAALFGVSRKIIEPAAGTRPEVLESDADLRRRVVLAPDSYSVAGPASAYVFHALSASGDVLDAAATSPAPGEVVVAILSREEGSLDGRASSALIATVDAALSADDIRPLTDQVRVESAAILSVAIEARLTLYPGPDATLMLDRATSSLDALIEQNRRIGRDLSRSAILAALHVGGVQKVELLKPVEDVVVDATSATAVVGKSITVAGFGE